MEATTVTDMPSTKARGYHRRQASGGSERQVLAADHDDDATEVWQSLSRVPSRSHCLSAY